MKHFLITTRYIWLDGSGDVMHSTRACDALSHNHMMHHIRRHYGDGERVHILAIDATRIFNRELLDGIRRFHIQGL